MVGLFAGVRGYLDKLDIGRVGAFESQLLTEIKARAPQIIGAIRDDKEIKPENEKALVAFLDGFAKSFV